MMVFSRFTRRFVFLVAWLAWPAMQAWAHHPFGHCVYQDASTIRCSGGFDGRPVAGMRIDVLDDQDRILIRGRLDDHGHFVFPKPSASPFYVLIDPGPGLTLQIRNISSK